MDSPCFTPFQWPFHISLCIHDKHQLLAVDIVIYPWESLHKYYLRFTQLINDMNIYNMKMEQFQVNTKFLNSLPPEWSKFVTDVKLVKDLHTTNFDQLYAYLEQHELHANEVCLLRERFAVPVFSPRDGLISCLNKTMAFLIVIASLRSMGLQRMVKPYSDNHSQTNALPLFRAEDLDTYDSDSMNLKMQKLVLYGQLFSNYGSDVVSEVPHSETYLNDMGNPSVRAMQDFKQIPAVNVTDNEITSDSNIISYS
ncbi:hypothetical protein Tco_0644127 [Tanacetum coccineum]